MALAFAGDTACTDNLYELFSRHVILIRTRLTTLTKYCLAIRGDEEANPTEYCYFCGLTQDGADMRGTGSRLLSPSEQTCFSLRRRGDGGTSGLIFAFRGGNDLPPVTLHEGNGRLFSQPDIIDMRMWKAIFDYCEADLRNKYPDLPKDV
jgi:hypothetical protein